MTAGPIHELWVLIYALQLVIYFEIYTVAKPFNANIFAQAVQSVIEFDLINPFRWALLSNSKFTLSGWLQGTYHKTSNDDKVQMVDDLDFVIWLVLLTFTCLLIAKFV